MASPTGRGAQVRLDGDAQQLARGGAGLRLIDSIRAKADLETTGQAASGLTPDGSTATGGPSRDEALIPSTLDLDGTLSATISAVNEITAGLDFTVFGTASNIHAAGDSPSVSVALWDKGGAGVFALSNDAQALKVDGPPLAANWIGIRSAITGGTPLIYSWGDANAPLTVVARGTGGLTIGSATNKIGHFGSDPVAKPTGVPVTNEGIHAALVSLGLISA